VGLAYFNPLQGGVERAQRTVLVGWGEGIEQATLFVARREASRCAEITLWGAATEDQVPCGRLVSERDDPDYLLCTSTSATHDPDALARLTEGREVVGRVSQRGVDYVDIYGPRRPADR
jgi:hypothetical protein